MSFVGSNILAGASGQGGGGGFAIERSLRFNSGDSAYLNRTPSAAGNRKKWTWSGWVKRSGGFESGWERLFSSFNSDALYIRFSGGSGTLDSIEVGGGYPGNYFMSYTSAVFRDPSAWYHIVIACDTTLSTAADRLKIYVNGVQQDTNTTGDGYIPQNRETGVNTASNHVIGGNASGGENLNGYLAEVNFIDGQALAPTDFGEFDGNNVWQAKKIEGNYTFSSTPTNLTPSSTAYPNTTLSNNNLTWTGSTANDTGTVSTLIPTNKKTYVEVTHTSTGGGNPGPGVANAPLSELGLDTVKAWWRGGTDGNISVSTLGSFSGSSTSWSNGDVLGIALDNTANSGAGSITFYKNGTQVWTGGSGWTSHSDLRFEWQNNGSGTSSGTWNFGATSFSYPLSGYTGLFSTQGANSFHLDFADNSSNAALGTDTSGVSPANTWTVNNLVAIVPTVQYGEDTSNSNFDSSATSLTYDTTGFTYNNVSSPKTDTGQANASTVLKSANGSAISWTFSTDSTDRYIWTSNNGINWSSTGSTYPVSSSPQTVTAVWVAWSGGSNASTLTINFGSASDIDSLVDTPINGDTASDTGLGGQITGNYCTLNPLKNQSQTLSNGNLVSNGTSGRSTGTIYASSGKVYWEFTAGSSYTMSGIESSTSPQAASYAGENDQQYALYGNNGSGQLYHNGGITSVDGFVSGDVIGVALDMDAGNLYFYKNGVAMNSGTAVATGLTGAWTANCRSGSGAYNGDTIFNFGSRPFAYAAPSGFKSLNTANLSSTIADGSLYFDTKLWNGTGSSQAITGYNFSPDFVWIKNRSSAESHALFDIVRGATKGLHSDLTQAEWTDTNTLTAFNSNGFTLNGHAVTNASSNSYAGWAWDAGSSTVSNTDGTVTSQVRASAASGFSIVSWTGTVNATVGHGLNTAPKLVITKRRAATTSWRPWSSEFSDIARNYLGFTSAAPGTFGSAYWGSMTSTTIGLKGLLDNNNGDMIAYCFAPVEGYSAISSYQGNGNASGPFVYTGFKPAFILLKNISNAASWRIHDSARDSFNVSATGLAPDTSSADAVSSTNIIDFLSNGFKLRGTGGSTNSSGNTYIYLAFASNPFASNGGLAR